MDALCSKPIYLEVSYLEAAHSSMHCAGVDLASIQWAAH